MIRFSNFGIGVGRPSFIICEVGQAHDGSLGIAHSMIDAAADSGADAVKFQTHIATEESTYDDKFRVRFSYCDKSRYDYWKRMEFSPDQWSELASHARERNLEFISSPFSEAAVELLERVGVRLWKLGSGELCNIPLLQCLAKTTKPIIASTGLHGWSDISSFAQQLGVSGCDFALLQCNSTYPTKLEEVGVNIIGEIRRRFGCLSGLSDHTGNISAPLYAISHGADIVEVHCTFDKRMFGPDSSSSITFDDLHRLVKLRNDFYILSTNLVDKDQLAQEKLHTKLLFSRSLAPRIDLPAGHIMRRGDFSVKKPGGGIEPSLLELYIGKSLSRDVSSNFLLKESDFIT